MKLGGGGRDGQLLGVADIDTVVGRVADADNLRRIAAALLNDVEFRGPGAIDGKHPERIVQALPSGKLGTDLEVTVSLRERPDRIDHARCVGKSAEFRLILRCHRIHRNRQDAIVDRERIDSDRVAERIDIAGVREVLHRAMVDGRVAVDVRPGIERIPVAGAAGPRVQAEGVEVIRERRRIVLDLVLDQELARREVTDDMVLERDRIAGRQLQQNVSALLGHRRLDQREVGERPEIVEVHIIVGAEIKNRVVVQDIEDIVATTAVQLIVTGSAIDDIVANVADNHVGLRVADRVDRQGAGQDQVLDVRRQRIDPVGHDRIDAFAHVFLDAVLARMDDIGVIALATDQRISAESRRTKCHHQVVAGGAIDNLSHRSCGESLRRSARNGKGHRVKALVRTGKTNLAPTVRLQIGNASSIFAKPRPT